MKKIKKILLSIENTERDLLLLLTIGGLYALGIFLSNTFVNVYLWRQTNDYMTIATYNLAIFTFQALTFILAGKLAKKIDRVIVLRLGVLFLSLFFITVLILSEQAAYYNIMLGSLLGVGYGFYWLAFNVLTFEITEPDTRDFFNGFIGVLESLGGMIAPILAGAIIAKLQTNIGYLTVFSISLTLFILAIVFSMLLKGRKATGKYMLKEVWKEIKYNRDWKNIVFANFFLGMREGIFVFVITIWIFLVTNSELALGMFHLVLNIMSLIVYLLLSKYLRYHHRLRAMFIGSFLISFSIFILVYDLHYLTFLLYAIIIGSAFPLLNVPFSSLTYDVIGKSHNITAWRIEYIVVFELFINIGRILSIIVLITMYVFFGETIIMWVLVVFSQAYICLYILMRKIKTIS